MSLRHAILGILEIRPMHGYQVKRVLDEGISGFWPVNLAAIYPSLRRLEEEGLVAHRLEATAEGRPDRKVYELTDAGREELARWRPLMPDGNVGWKNPLYLKLLFARSENYHDALGWVEKALEEHRAAVDQIRTELANPDLHPTFFVRFMRESGLAHNELQVEMLSELRERLIRELASE